MATNCQAVEIDAIPEIRINISEIPNFRRKELAEVTLSETEAYFKQPGVEERYQAWLKDRRAGERLAKEGG